MNQSFETAAAHAKTRRAALLRTLAETRQRISPPQLVEDAVRLIDPELSLLGRLKQRVRQNRLLSLAVLAAAGWLAGGRAPPPLRRRASPGGGRINHTTTRKLKGEAG